MSFGPFPCDWEARPLGRAEGLPELQAATVGLPRPLWAAHPPPACPLRRVPATASRAPQHGPCCVCWAGNCPLGDVPASLLLPVPSQGLRSESTAQTVPGFRGEPSFVSPVRLAHRGLNTRLPLVRSHAVLPFILWIK